MFIPRIGCNYAWQGIILNFSTALSKHLFGVNSVVSVNNTWIFKERDKALIPLEFKPIKFPAHVMLFARGMRGSLDLFNTFKVITQFSHQVILSNTFKFNPYLCPRLSLSCHIWSNSTHAYAIGCLCLFLSILGFNLRFRTRLSHSIDVFPLKSTFPNNIRVFLSLPYFQFLKMCKEG